MALERRAVPFSAELLDFLLSLHSRVSSLASEDSSFSDRSAPTSAKNFLLRLLDQLSFPPQRCDWPGARLRSFGSGAHWLGAELLVLRQQQEAGRVVAGVLTAVRFGAI